jgi:hypothetical protein
VPALVDIKLPYDFDQIPDIFVDVYSNTTFSDNVRVAYVRIKAQDCISMRPKPNWFRLSSPYNDTGSTNLGMLMMSIQFVKYDGTGQFNPVRTCMEKNAKDITQYKFYW